MDDEEFEQIPWSSLMTDSAQGVDPKVYVAVGIVGIIVAVVFGARLFGGSSAQPPTQAETPGVSAPVIGITTTTGLIISEADLMAGQPEISVSTDALRQVAFAEWFVTDYYTVDGSTENERSLRDLFTPTASTLLLPHSADPPAPATYVEWARSVDVRDIGDDMVEVDVVYRTITESDSGFVRDPVSAVVVTVRSSSVDAGIVGLPVPIDVPMPGARVSGSQETVPEDS